MQADDDQTSRLAVSMEALNARIARLAMALGVNLDDRAAVDALMVKQLTFPGEAERRRASAAGSHDTVTSERRTAHKREELRGLLVLRYQMETTSLNDNGFAATRQVMAQAKEHLVRQGFKPGADGLGLNVFFDLD
jgi:hypothetical protein